MAPTNSPTKYGNGLILVFLQKKIKFNQNNFAKWDKKCQEKQFFL